MWRHDVCEAHAEEDETEGEGDPGRELEVGGGQQEPANILLIEITQYISCSNASQAQSAQCKNVN